MLNLHGSWALCTALLLHCGAAPPEVETNPVRKALLQDLAAARSVPVVLRYNPAQCACPDFEAKIGAQWLRAELIAAEPVSFATWRAALAQAPVDAWPLGVTVVGNLHKQLWRTVNGLYAVRVDVAAVVAPLVAAPEVPVAAPDPAAAPPVTLPPPAVPK